MTKHESLMSLCLGVSTQNNNLETDFRHADSNFATKFAYYLNDHFRPGGINNSIFTLIVAIIGPGTITLPYLAASNGIVMAVFLIVFGAIISHF